MCPFTVKYAENMTHIYSTDCDRTLDNSLLNVKGVIIAVNKSTITNPYVSNS